MSRASAYDGLRAGLQAHREMEVYSPLGDALLFHAMTGHEQLGGLFEYRLQLFSERANIPIDDVLGQNLTVRVDRPDGEPRYFNGYVTEFGHVGESGNYLVYEATLHPWLWFLTRTADCRIFQGTTVPDIIKQVFREHGYPIFAEALFESYRPWDYCVQYRESDFDFVSRLMEQEGIYYYFDHAFGNHTMILCDSPSSHNQIAGYESLPYRPPDEAQRQENECVFDWQVSKEIQSDRYALNDFDFKRPKSVLETRAGTAKEHARPVGSLGLTLE